MCSAKSYKYFEGNLGLCHYPCHHALVVLTSWTFHEHKNKDVIREFIWQTKNVWKMVCKEKEIGSHEANMEVEKYTFRVENLLTADRSHDRMQKMNST